MALLPPVRKLTSSSPKSRSQTSVADKIKVSSSDCRQKLVHECLRKKPTIRQKTNKKMEVPRRRSLCGLRGGSRAFALLTRVSGSLIQEKALKIDEDRDVTEFKVSDSPRSWLDSSRKRHNVTFGAASGEEGTGDDR